MWLLRCSVGFLSRRVCAEGCFRIVSDSAGSVGVVASFPAGSECELQESVAAVAGCAYDERCRLVRSCCGWVCRRPTRLCGCVAKAERAYVWCGLHRCRDCSLRSRSKVHAEGCFRIMSDSAGSAGVVCGSTLVVGRGVTLFRCFEVLCSRCLSLYYFLE
ncbi:hypothetical protein Taro_006772 [Colocasia esculenta]|uniref:Secreted protein n=1 Tax=Colocasia esculenta TaxID=4460 RepID=A0A843TWA3_COLES|nr:hypothetical protein [Colocasia esculenta]